MEAGDRIAALATRVAELVEALAVRDAASLSWSGFSRRPAGPPSASRRRSARASPTRSRPGLGALRARPERRQMHAAAGPPRSRGHPGTICQASASTGTDLVPTHEAIEAHVAAAPALAMDETGWRIGGKPSWLCVATTNDATVYDVARSRGFDQATGLVPADYAGTIVRDGWAVYGSYDKASHQTCLAHACPATVPRDDRGPARLGPRHAPPGPRPAARGPLTPATSTGWPARRRHRPRRALRPDVRAVPSPRRQPPAGQAPVTRAPRPVHVPDHQRCRRHELQGRASGEAGGRQSEYVGCQQDRSGTQDQGRVMTFLRTAHQQGADAIAMLVDLVRTPNPGVVAGLTLRTV